MIVADLGEKEDTNNSVPTGTTVEMDEIAGELAHEYNIQTMTASVDVTNRESIIEMVEKIKTKFPVIHILCNNAGASFGVPNDMHTYDEEAWLKTIAVNLHGVFRISRAILPLMMDKGGAIINTASRAGKVPALFNGAYAAAKSGVIVMTKVMASELAPSGIRVNAICTG